MRGPSGWHRVYTKEVDSYPLGYAPGGVTVQSSLYRALRTNLPRETMDFRDYPFLTRNDGTGDPRRFRGHWEVLMYLKEFSREFGIEDMGRFATEVASLVDDNNWTVRSTKKGDAIE